MNFFFFLFRFEHQEQEGPNAARPLPGSESLQSSCKMPKRKLFKVVKCSNRKTSNKNIHIDFTVNFELR